MVHSLRDDSRCRSLRDRLSRLYYVFTLTICVLFLLRSYVAAAPYADDEPVHLSLVDAIEMAFSYDLDHEIARLQWDNARIDNLIAEASGPASVYEQLQRDLQERRAEHTYFSARDTLVRTIVQQYFEVNQAKRQVEITRRQADIARRELAVVGEMVRIGERHPQDELRERNRVAAAELSAETAARTYVARRSALLDRLGLAESTEVILVDDPQVVPFNWTLEETIAFALEHSFSVWEREMNVRLAELDLEAIRVQDPAPLQLAKAENNFRVTQLSALQGERTFHTNVAAAYYAVVDSAHRYEAARVDYDLALASFESARRQHEAGLTTDIDWERAQLERLTAQQSYLEAAATYMRERLELFNVIGYSSGIDEEFASR